MFEMITEWMLSFSGSPWGVVVLAGNAASEAVFNPFPADPLLLAMSFLRPELALIYGAVCTVASVLGGIVGWVVGLKLGRPVAVRMLREERFAKVEGMFGTYGSWAILVAAISPIPYKFFAVGAGVMEFSIAKFVVVSVVGRGLRFMLIAGVIFWFGDAVVDVIQGRILVFSIGVGAVILGVLGVLLIKARLNVGER
jgi:membrane protein YqaA with SNARE-associated domain